MTNLDIRRAQFLRQRQTLSKISGETGIPVSSLSYITRGLRHVPSKYKTTLSNYYRRESYSRLRDQGLSSYQANRFKWYPPERVLGVENTMREKLLELTMGAMAAAARHKGGKLKASEVLRDFEKHLETMKKAIQKSPKTFEAIEKYGTILEEDKPH